MNPKKENEIAKKEINTCRPPLAGLTDLGLFFFYQHLAPGGAIGFEDTVC
ncbi:MAG: hypothetical protein IH597_15285 [Bacteroidales bacterium]|nr:hypothetical protein [Bacteroidales bacterium]